METAIAERETFAAYMDRVLYGPEGYYASGKARSGRDGDYFTAPDSGSAFGTLLGLIFQRWQSQFGIQPFHLVEAGPGEGALAQQVRKTVSFPYTAIERSPFRQGKLKALGLEVFPDLSSLASHPVSGCLFANELLDAFPVHRVRMKNGRLEEGYVTQNSGLSTQNSEWGVPSTPKLKAYLERIKIELPEGYETEINLAMADWFVEAGRAMNRGLVLLIDYGRPAHAYYAPERTQGTLRSFSGHQVGPGFLAKPGEMDLTADVDFTSAALDARAAGFSPLAYMELGSFLLPGVELLTPEQAAAARGLKYLIHPDGMGSSFQVLLLGKGLAVSPNDFPHNRLKRLEM